MNVSKYVISSNAKSNKFYIYVMIWLFLQCKTIFQSLSAMKIADQ